METAPSVNHRASFPNSGLKADSWYFHPEGGRRTATNYRVQKCLFRVSSDQQVQSFCLHPAHKGASLVVVAGGAQCSPSPGMATELPQEYRCPVRFQVELEGVDCSSNLGYSEEYDSFITSCYPFQSTNQ